MTLTAVIEEIIIWPKKEEEESIQALDLPKKMLYPKCITEAESSSPKSNLLLKQKLNNLLSQPRKNILP